MSYGARRVALSLWNDERRAWGGAGGAVVLPRRRRGAVYIPFHYITLHYRRSRGATSSASWCCVHYITLHYITLHYITGGAVVLPRRRRARAAALGARKPRRAGRYGVASPAQPSHHAITQSRHHAITPSRNHAITQSRHHAITQSRNHAITQSRNHAITQSRNHAITRHYLSHTLMTFETLERRGVHIFHSIPSHSIPPHSVPFRSIPSRSVPSRPVPFQCPIPLQYGTTWYITTHTPGRARAPRRRVLTRDTRATRAAPRDATRVTPRGGVVTGRLADAEGARPARVTPYDTL